MNGKLSAEFSATEWLENLPRKQCESCGKETIFDLCGDCESNQSYHESYMSLQREIEYVSHEMSLLQERLERLRQELLVTEQQVAKEHRGHAPYKGSK